ncbi:MAG: DUF4358 domain-containing protein [Oscillospiraceae bacterium]|nr:DUF4358 domain-containing protein [Oscillospiraceae bacterium]
MAAALLAACGQSPAGTDSTDPGTVAAAILESVEFRDNLIKAEGEVAENFYRLDSSVDSYAIYISGSGATAEEIAVLKVAGTDKTADAKAILEMRVDELKRRFEDYVPGEMVKLDQPVIITEGVWAILVLADDQSAARSAVRDALEPV